VRRIREKEVGVARPTSGGMGRAVDGQSEKVKREALKKKQLRGGEICLPVIVFPSIFFSFGGVLELQNTVFFSSKMRPEILKKPQRK
jgi:hypothetical protein